MTLTTSDQRLTVAILFERFDADDDARAKAFSTIFDKELRNCGIFRGLSTNAIISEYNKRKYDNSQAWRVISHMLVTPRQVSKRDSIAQQCSRILEGMNGRSTDNKTTTANAVATPAERRRGRPKLQISGIVKASKTRSSTASTIKVVRRVSAVLVRSFGLQGPPCSTPVTPRNIAGGSRIRRSQRADATVLYSPRPGYSLSITPKESQTAGGSWNWPTNGQPEITCLLYRFWDSRSSQSVLETDGFTAGQFKHMRSIPAPPAPCPEYPMWNSMAAHLNRDPVSTAFVSASIDLCWTLRNAVDVAQGGEHRFISVVIPTALPRRPYHASLFHAECRKRFCFTDAAWLYSGQSEFLCYEPIPSAAVIRTFSVRSLLDFVVSTPTAAALLRLNKLTQHRVGYAKKREAFKNQAIGINSDTIIGIAEIAKFLGLDHGSTLGHIAGVVSGIVQGWALVIDPRSSSDLEVQAATFADHMHTGERPCAAKDLQMAKLAFLEGLKWGNARDRNPRFNVVTANRVEKRATKVGLGSPVKVLYNELDKIIKDSQEAKAALLACSQKNGLPLPSPRLLADADPGSDVIMEDVLQASEDEVA